MKYAYNIGDIVEKLDDSKGNGCDPEMRGYLETCKLEGREEECGGDAGGLVIKDSVAWVLLS